MNENDGDYRDADDTKKRKGLWWLWPLLALLAILLLLWFFFMKKDDASNIYGSDNKNQSTASNTNSQNSDKQTLKQQFEQKYNGDARTVYFNADTAVIQDEASAAAKLGAIAAFAKAYPNAKLQVNGSIFDTNEADSASTLAKQRAELIQTKLVEKGVNQANITVSTLNKYEGQDEAARAMYSRSVVVTVKE